MKKLVICFLFCLVSGLLIAQPVNGKISGIVKAPDGKPLETATVVLQRTSDSSIVKTGITDKQGRFLFNPIPAGNYFIWITMTGHQDQRTAPFGLDVNNIQVELPSFTLLPAAKDLNSVTVTAQKSFIERKIDKLIVNVAASPMSAGQSAFDILERSPGVTVDENDNISINGKQGVMIYIDGKLSYLSGKDLTTYLRALPASQLDQLEIMTQPSARYDAAGNSGIINFKTKKNQNNGFNGNLSASVVFAHYFKTRNSLVLNWKKNKFNISGSYGISDNKIFYNQTLVKSYRANSTTPFNRYFDQSSRTTREFFLQNARISADYQASKTTTIGVVLIGNSNQTPSTISGRINVLDSLRQPAGYTDYVTDSRLPVRNPSVNINLQKKLKGNKELTADADYVSYHNSSSQTISNYRYDKNNIELTPDLVRNSAPLDVSIYSFKSDYSQALPGNAKLEAGIKTSYVKTDINGQYNFYDTIRHVWLPDSGRINHFIYQENINAAYVNVNAQLNKKWTVQAGLRAEQTHDQGNEKVKGSRFTNDYVQLFPSLFASYSLDDKNIFTLTYGRRIDRPSYQFLNPFQYALDEFNYREGNPYLKPIITNNIEFSYNYKSMLNLSMNYTRSVNMLGMVFRNVKVGNNYITYQTPTSIASKRNMGIGINFHKSIRKWWTTNTTVNIFNNKFSDYLNGQHITPDITICIVSVSNQFPLKKGWVLDLSGFFRSKRLEGFPVYAIPNGAFSFGASKKINDRATITLNMNDPLWLLKGGITSNTETFTYKGRSRMENRYATLTFSYKFGKILQQQNRRNVGTPDEQNRL